jgi:hypothetical protein
MPALLLLQSTHTLQPTSSPMEKKRKEKMLGQAIRQLNGPEKYLKHGNDDDV